MRMATTGKIHWDRDAAATHHRRYHAVVDGWSLYVECYHPTYGWHWQADHDGATTSGVCYSFVDAKHAAEQCVSGPMFGQTNDGNRR